jgi:hypothetical protein
VLIAQLVHRQREEWKRTTRPEVHTDHRSWPAGIEHEETRMGARDHAVEAAASFFAKIYHQLDCPSRQHALTCM